MNGMIWAGPWSALSMLAPAGGVMSAPANTAVQQDDDWEFAADPARGLTAASVRYDDGKAVVVQCAPAGLRVVIVGLPATTAGRRTLAASRADGRTDTQVWFAEPGTTAFTSTVSGRDARFLRGGGLLELRSPAGGLMPIHASFDLPTRNAGLDRVLTACGYAVTDERDLVPRAGEDLKTQWEADHADEIARAERGSSSPFGGGRRSVSGRGPSRGAPPAPEPSDLNCIVRGGVYADCSMGHTLVGPRAEERTEATLTRMNGIRLESVSAAANEGRAVYPAMSVSVLIMVERTELF